MTRTLLIALTLASATPLAGQQTPLDSLKRTPRPPAVNVSWPTIAGAVGIVAFSALFDPSVARAAAHHQGDDLARLGDNLDRMGEMTVIVPVVLGTAAVGLVTKNRELIRVAVRTGTAIAFVSVVGQGLKFATGRDRPYQDEDFDAVDFKPFSAWDTSFPSGHTAAAFALATTLGDAIGSPWIQGGLYVLAGATGWARIAQQKHWSSDVVAGAAVGILSGKIAAGKVKFFGLRAPRILVTPDAAVVSFGVPAPRLH